MKPTASAAKDGGSSTSWTNRMSKSTSPPKFVLCVRPGDSGDLEVRKVYEILPDPKAAKEGYFRIIDESGEDYLYPAEYFSPVKLPAATIRDFASALSPARDETAAR